MVDLLKDQMIGTSKVLVISPLKALMLDQVEKLKQTQTGVTAQAIYDGQDEDILKLIEDSEYSLVFASPEILASERWRNLLLTSHYQENCEIIVVDEAHCVVHWYV